MSTTAVGHCDQCAAVVNRHWLTCLVCNAPLPAPSREEALTEALSPIPPLHPGWRELAQLTAGLERDDPRLNPVLDMMIEGAKLQDAGDALGFEKATERVQRLMQFAPGALVRWQASEGHQSKVLGPATVEFVHVADNQLWVWTTWKGQGRWVPESVITTIEKPRQNHLE